MMRLPVLFRLAVTATAALALSACITLLPKSKPAQLYRFGQPVTTEALTAAPGRVGVFRSSGLFQRESANDRILTITSGKAAYVADTRWVAPAATLWDEAVVAAFDADGGTARLISRGESATADYVLRLDVRNFEARYDQGAKAAPTVVVRVRAAITRGNDRGLVSERMFESRVDAADNRVTAIVPAYDQAVAEVLTGIVAWTNEQAKPPEPKPA